MYLLRIIRWWLENAILRSAYEEVVNGRTIYTSYYTAPGHVGGEKDKNRAVFDIVPFTVI